MDRLDHDLLTEGLGAGAIGSQVVIFESTASTNDIAAGYARNLDSHGLVVFAEEQTAGRGRGANHWLTGKGDSLLCSIVLTRCGLQSELLSLTVAVATAEAIGNGSRIKWPNDIMISCNKKVAGILVESRAFEGHTAWIVGIGINCHQGRFPSDIEATATSLDLATDQRVDRICLARRLLVGLNDWFVRATTEPWAVVDRWGRLSIQLHHRVTVVYDGRRFTGYCIGVDPGKGLIVQLDRGGVRMFDAAHSTLAKGGGGVDLSPS